MNFVLQFVLHQIRKMIGASLYILWGDEYLPKKAFEVALKGTIPRTFAHFSLISCSRFGVVSGVRCFPSNVSAQLRSFR